MKQQLQILVETSEDLVKITIEVDKEKFKKVIEPLLLLGMRKLDDKTA